MRNGIYRVWYKGPGLQGTTAVMLIGQDVFACDRTHTFVGTYKRERDWVTAEILCQRHSPHLKANLLAELNEYHLSLKGRAKDDLADLRGTIAEAPGVELEFQYIWLCEA